MRRGVSMPVVHRHVVRRPRADKAALVDSARRDFETGRTTVPPKGTWPERGGVDWIFQEARKRCR